MLDKTNLKLSIKNQTPTGANDAAKGADLKAQFKSYKLQLVVTSKWSEESDAKKKVTIDFQVNVKYKCEDEEIFSIAGPKLVGMTAVDHEYWHTNILKDIQNKAISKTRVDDTVACTATWTYTIQKVPANSALDLNKITVETANDKIKIMN